MRLFRPIAILLLVAFVTIAIPSFSRSITAGGDLFQHIRMAENYKVSLRSGQLFPNWTLDNQGRGSVAVRVYPPINPLLTALAWLTLGDLFWAFLLTFVVWLFLSMFGTFLLLSRVGSESAAMIGAIACGIAPHHLALIFKYSLYAEFAAVGLLPFPFIFLTRLIERNSWLDALLLSVSLSLVIFTHLPLSVICVPLLVVYGAVLCADVGSIFRALGKFVLAIGLSALLTSVFWIRWIIEASWIAHFREADSGGGSSFEMYLFPVGFFEGVPRPFGHSVLFLNAEVILTILPVIAWAGLSLVHWVYGKREKDRSARATFVTATVCTVMLTWLSYPIWASVDLLRKIQFSFRFLSPLGVFAAAIIGLFAARRSEFDPVRRFALISGLIVLGVAWAALDLKMIASPVFTKDRGELQAFLEESAELQGSKWWLPVWANNEFLAEKVKKGEAGHRRVDVVSFGQEARAFVVGEGRAGDRLDTATYFYPYWSVTMDGRRVEPEVNEKGVMVIPLPAGSAEVKIKFNEPASDRIAKVVSVVGWLFASLAGVLLFLRSKGYAIFGRRNVLKLAS